jgi:hypothetical protein
MIISKNDNSAMYVRVCMYVPMYKYVLRKPGMQYTYCTYVYVHTYIPMYLWGYVRTIHVHTYVCMHVLMLYIYVYKYLQLKCNAVPTLNGDLTMTLLYLEVSVCMYRPTADCSYVSRGRM